MYQDEKCKNCGHDIWDHHCEEVVHEDGDESLYFEECLVEGCDCRNCKIEED